MANRILPTRHMQRADWQTMSWIDVVIGAGAAIAGGGLTYLGGARDRRQRAADAREDRDYASRRDACLLLERQRTLQLETAEALVAKYRRGTEFVEREDHSDIQNPNVDAMVSLFLPGQVETAVEEANGRWNAFLSSCSAIDTAEHGQPRFDAYKGMNVAFERLKESSLSLRQLLRDEARSK